MDNRMNGWLRTYEQHRTDPYASIKGQLSSRFDLEGLSWAEIREIPIPELGEGMNFGKSFEALRKTWYAYKRSKKDGLPATDLAFRILNLQKFLGLPLSEFEELDRYGGGSNNEWVEEELSRENQQLRKEEETEELAGWGLDDEKTDDDPW
jgi:hypothetical protein